MSGKVGAYGITGKASDTGGFRKEWNQEDYTAKAREKDRENQERAIEAEEYARQGKKAPRKKDDLPKPTELMKAREGPLELDKNLNKTIIVNGGTGSAQPGFYCDICKRTNKDSVAYLDHINGRSHLRKLGQTTRVVKSSLNDVRVKIAELRARTAETAESKKYDFEKRIKEIKAAEIVSKAEQKELKKQKKIESKIVVVESSPGDEEMMRAMGIQSFGSTKV